MAIKPKVLVATTSRWVPTARLAAALAEAGFAVEAVCPTGHQLRKIACVERCYPCHGTQIASSFARAIRSANPTLIVSGDDLATLHLHKLHAESRKRGADSESLCALIERSLGNSGGFPVVYARSRFIEVAQDAGVRCPATEVITSERDLENFVQRSGWPLVLKANVTSGGEGVRVVRNIGEARQQFRTLGSAPSLAKAAKRAIIDRDSRLVWPALSGRRPIVNAQAFVGGREATSLVACWQGQVLASLHFVIMTKTDLAGPATVLRRIDHPEMIAATEKTAARLGLSGLHGFDFMLEAGTDNAYLIEINPRTTQVGHLTLGEKRDLPAALYAAVTAQPVRPARTLTENETIALFPQEWLRDPASPYLKSAYHDVPWSEQELVRDCIRVRNKRNAWYQRRPVAQSYVSPFVLPDQVYTAGTIAVGTTMDRPIRAGVSQNAGDSSMFDLKTEPELSLPGTSSRMVEEPVLSHSPARKTESAVVSIIIVVWNAKKYVIECLESLRKHIRNIDAEVIVVDNASTDGSPELVAERFPEFKLIRNSENLGFAKANNIGIAQSTGDYVCLVNSDVTFVHDCFTPMLQYLEGHPSVAMVGPKMLSAAGETRRSTMRFPTVWNSLSRAIGLDLLFKRSALFGGLLMSDFDHERTMPVEVLIGWFVLMRRSALEKVGSLDPQFFMYGEDVDWCYRFRQAGEKIVFFAGAEAIHYGGASSAKAPVRFMLEMYRANLQYWRKHHTHFQQMCFLFSLGIYDSARVIGLSLSYPFASAKRPEISFKLKRSLACLQWTWRAMRSREFSGEAQPAMTS